MDTPAVIAVVVYLLVHGACLPFAWFSYRQMDWPGYEKYKDKALYMRIQPLIQSVGFLLGPFGVLLYVFIHFAMPASQKVWLE